MIIKMGAKQSTSPKKIMASAHETDEHETGEHLLARFRELKMPSAEAKGDRERLVSLLGLQVGTTEAPGTDIIEWRSGLGFQSKSVSLRGPRWIAHCKPDGDVANEGAAFVKLLPTFTVQELQELLASRAREDAETAARALGNTEEEATNDGEDAANEATAVNPVEPSVQLVRERFFLRKWWAAVHSGELKLPDDSLLVIPRLFEGAVVDEYAAEQEECPTLLVMEDLVSMGFKSRKVEDDLTNEEAECLVQALADLHSGMWSIRDQICQGPFVNELIDAGSCAYADVADSLPAGVVTAARTGVNRAAFARLIREAITESEHVLADPTAESIRPKEADVDRMVEAAFDTGAGLRLLCHGDPWVHNYMIRHDHSGSVTGVAFVDFSGICRANVLTDFFGFLFTSSFRKESATGVDLKDVFLQRLMAQVPLALVGQDMDAFNDRAKGVRAIANGLCCLVPYFVYTKLFDGNHAAAVRRLSFLQTCALQAEKAEAVEQLNQLELDPRVDKPSCVRRRL
jgi:hypothetical protein